MNQNHLFYVAGLFDGEGYITDYKGRIQIGLQNTDLRLLRRVHGLFGGYLGVSMRGSGNHQTLFTWTLKKTEDVLSVLKILVELLIGKKEEALLAISIIENGGTEEKFSRLRGLKRSKLQLSLEAEGLVSLDDLPHTIESAGPKLGGFSEESRTARRNLTGEAWQEKYGNRKKRSDSKSNIPKISDEEDLFGGN